MPATYRPSPGERFFQLANGAFMLFLVTVTAYPIFHVLMASLSAPADFAAHQGLVLAPVGGATLASFKAVLGNPMILSGYGNTLFIVVAGLCVNLTLTSMGAYVLSRKNLLWSKAILGFIVFTMFFSGGLIPSFLNIRNLGLYNSLWAVILPGAVNTFNLIIMRTSFLAIPDSLVESAKIDGASHFRVLFQIILPLSKAVLAVMALYYGVAHWNAWFNAMIYITDRSKFPLQVVLREILIQNQTLDMMIGMDGDQAALGETIKYATIVVSTAPILALYPFLQKYFVKGTLVGAVKG